MTSIAAVPDIYRIRRGRRVCFCRQCFLPASLSTAISPVLQSTSYDSDAASYDTEDLGGPEGFRFTGDLEEDLDRMELWEAKWGKRCSSNGMGLTDAEKADMGCDWGDDSDDYGSEDSFPPPAAKPPIKLNLVPKLSVPQRGPEPHQLPHQAAAAAISQAPPKPPSPKPSKPALAPDATALSLSSSASLNLMSRASGHLRKSRTGMSDVNMSLDSMDLSQLHMMDEDVTLKMPPSRPLVVPRLSVPAVQPEDPALLPTGTPAWDPSGGGARDGDRRPPKPGGGKAAAASPTAAGQKIPTSPVAGGCGNNPQDGVYRTIRAGRFLYQDPEVHCLLLELVLRLLLTPQGQVRPCKMN